MSTYLEPIFLNEAQTKAQKLIGQLDSIPLGRMYQASFKAVVRLHLFFTGRTHELFAEFADQARALILKKGGSDQVLDSTSGFEVQIELLKKWGIVFATWSNEFQKVRVEAASIPFGVLAVTHDRLVRPAVSDEQLAESEIASLPLAMTEGVEDGVFSPQLSILLNAASEHLYGDSLNLSARIWQVENGGREAIIEVLLRGIANGDSAWNIAQELEQFLGANMDCPRWTSTRLYGRTKTQIANGDTAGLQGKTGSPCDGAGVSYNALRLARTEIQKAHALATDRIMAAQPWVEKEQVHLSSAHSGNDICDETIAGGEGGKGIYDVGTIELPLHPNCLCFKTAVLMDEKEFTSQLNAWLKGEGEWAEMDAYAALVSGGLDTETAPLQGSLLPNAINLAVWLFGNSDQLLAFGGAAK
jgi:hypothetical protein